MQQMLFAALFILFFTLPSSAETWSAKLDKDIRFYQTTEMGVVLAGTEKSLYALDGSSGEILWRRKDTSLDETDVAPVPGTDLLLLSFEKGDKTRVEAVDILNGDTVWRSDKIKGAVMQVAVDPSANLLAVVMVKDARDQARENFKRHPFIHVLELSSGAELWRSEVSEVEMMPARWPEDNRKEVDYTFDNYYPPVFIDDRLYVFYEGVTSFDARSGAARLREHFRVNEEGLALTEAAPIFDQDAIYTSGRGHLRAISRITGKQIWEANDLGLTPEIIATRDVIYVRTGGQFTRLKDGENEDRGPYGVSAVDARTGRVLWRFKGADKGITNLLLPTAGVIAVADRDDLIFIDARNGKRMARVPHHLERASFGILNERGDVVIGGVSEVAAFEAATGREIWRERHSSPGRGLLRTVTAIAARAASLYFRYGGTALTAMRGLQIATYATGGSWSGLLERSAASNLQALATSSARSYTRSPLRQFGIASLGRGNNQGESITKATLMERRAVNVEDRLLDRLDPAHQLERVSRFLWHRDRLAALRGNWMYFYTDLRASGGRGLAGVNINSGTTDREIRLGSLDDRFITDDVLGLLFAATGNRLSAYPVQNH